MLALGPAKGPTARLETEGLGSLPKTERLKKCDAGNKQNLFRSDAEGTATEVNGVGRIARAQRGVLFDPRPPSASHPTGFARVHAGAVRVGARPPLPGWGPGSRGPRGRRGVQDEEDPRADGREQQQPPPEAIVARGSHGALAQARPSDVRLGRRAEAPGGP